MNVRSATAQRVDQEHIHEPHHGSVFAHPRESGKVYLLIVFNYLDILGASGFEIDTIERYEIRVSDPTTIGTFAGALEHHVVNRNCRQFDFSRGTIVFRDRLLNACFCHDYGFDVKAGHELDVVHGKHVRWIDHCKCEGGANA